MEYLICGINDYQQNLSNLKEIAVLTNSNNQVFMQSSVYMLVGCSLLMAKGINHLDHQVT